jgi:hypothetical protein
VYKATGQARVVVGGQHHHLGLHRPAESKVRGEQLVRKLISGRAAAEV